MLTNVIGMALTLAACAALGFYFSNIGAFRLQDLLEFKKALLILKAEIEYAATPLPEAMANIAQRVNAPLSQLFADFAQKLSAEKETAYRLWTASLAAHKKSLYLLPEDADALDAFGKTLGYLDKQMQSDTIRLTVDYIDAKIEHLQGENAKQARMYRSLGLLGGLLLVVVFW